MAQHDPWQIVDIPPSLRTPAQAAALRAAAGRDAELADVDAHLDEAMDALRAALDPAVSPALMTRLSARLAEEASPAPAESLAASLKGAWARLTQAMTLRWAWAPAALAAALLMVFWPGADEPSTRLRGVSSSAAVSVGLDVAVEGPGGAVSRVEGGLATAGPADGLVFRLPHRGGGQVHLLERAPSGAVSIIFSQSVEGGGGPVRITGPDGAEQRWRPEGEAGVWAYQAVLTAEASVLSAEALWGGALPEGGARSQIVSVRWEGAGE